MNDDEAPRNLNWEERKRQKALSRQRDEERLARAEITPIELQRENNPFRKLRRDRIMFTRWPKTGELTYLSLDPKPKPKDDEKK
ncbi:MAG: hypothetical protein ACN4E6_05280 [Qipengyuania pacifica]